MIAIKIIDGDVAIGLKPADVQKLNNGVKLVIRGHTLNISHDIVLMQADTEAVMLKKMSKSGRLGSGIIINVGDSDGGPFGL